jgi:hypothetical protein
MVEHLLILLIQSLEKQDREERAALHRVVPKLRTVYDDPVAVLEEREIVIGPTRQQNVATLLGVIAGLVTAGALILLEFFLAEAALNGKPWPGWLVGVAFAIGAMALSILPIWTTRRIRRWYEGGRITMRRHSVEFHYRGQTIFCPWALFRVYDPIVKEQSAQLRLSVNPAAREYVQMHHRDQTTLEGLLVSTKWFRFAKEDELVLKILYAAQPTELGRLLHHLGERLA